MKKNDILTPIGLVLAIGFIFFAIAQGKGGETLLLIRRFHTGSSFNDCGNEKRFVDIDTTTGLINNFHSQELLSK